MVALLAALSVAAAGSAYVGLHVTQPDGAASLVGHPTPFQRTWESEQGGTRSVLDVTVKGRKVRTTLSVGPQGGEQAITRTAHRIPEDDSVIGFTLGSEAAPGGRWAVRIGATADAVRAGSATASGRDASARRDVPRLVEHTAPQFPAAAWEEGHTDATCQVDLVVSAAGEPSKLAVSDCPEVFHAATRAAVATWTFAPALTKDGPITAPMTVRVRFARR